MGRGVVRVVIFVRDEFLVELVLKSVGIGVWVGTYGNIHALI